MPKRRETVDDYSRFDETDLPQGAVAKGSSAPPMLPAEGLRHQGNLDPYDRKALENPDGSVSTASTISIGTDEGEVLIPTVVDGKRLTAKQAIEHYRKTGMHFGVFDTPQHANAYAESLHNEQARRLGFGDDFATDDYAQFDDTDIPQPEPAPVAAPPPEEPGFWEGVVTNPLKTGYQRAIRSANLITGTTGAEDPGEAAADIAARQKAIAAIPQSEAAKQAEAEARKADSEWGRWKAYLKRPSAIAAIALESLAESSVGLSLGAGTGAIAGTAGGSIGGPPLAIPTALGGTMAGIGMGSYATEYGNTLADTLQNANVDLTDPDAILKAFQNKPLMQEAKKRAHARGIPVAVFDALSMGVAGRLMKPVGAITKRAGKVVEKTAGATAELAGQASFGAAGEASAQLADQGEITDRLAITQEALGELGPGAVEAGGGSALEARRQQLEKAKAAATAPSLLDEIAKAQEEPSTGRAETADIENVQNKARAAAAAQGGDNLDQEVAASVAALDHTAKARQSSEAAFDYVEQTLKAQAEQAKSVAFDQAEETAAVQKQTQEGILERQGQAQTAIDAAKGAPEAAAPATLADVWPAQPAAAEAPAAPKTLTERRSQATTTAEAPKIKAPLALPAPKSGPTITTREFRTGKKGQRLKGTVPTTKEGGGTVVVSPAGEAQVLSENTPTAPGTTTGYGTLAIRRQAVKEERPRVPVVETTRPAPGEKSTSPEPSLEDWTRGEGHRDYVLHITDTANVPSILKYGLRPTKYSYGPVEGQSGFTYAFDSGLDASDAAMMQEAADFRGEDLSADERAGRSQSYIAIRRDAVADRLEEDPATGNVRILGAVPPSAIRAVGHDQAPNDTQPTASPQTIAERKAQKAKRGETVPQRAEKTEPKERPVAKPKPGKVSKQEPAPAPTPKAAKQQGPTLAERKAQSAAAKAKNETAKAVAEAKAAVEQKAAEKPAGPKLRYAEGTLTTLRPRWKRTTTAKGLSRWDYGNRGSVEEFINEAGESQFAAMVGGIRTQQPQMKTFHTSDIAQKYVEQRVKEQGMLQSIDNTYESAVGVVKRDFRAPTAEERTPHRPPHVSLVDAQAAVQSLTKALGPSYQVLASPEDAPPHIFEKMAEDDKLDAPGVYDVDNDVAYTFAENNATVEDVKRNAAHEAVAHLGWRRLGNAAEHAETMEDIFQMAEDKAWMQNFASQHGLDESSIADRNLIADEYVAHVAESGTDLPVFKKMVAYARSVLRKHFPDVKWTEDDIRYMLHRAKTKILKGSGHAWHHPKQTGVRYAPQPTPPNVNAPGPEGMGIRQDLTKEQQAAYNPDIVASRIDALKNAGHDSIPLMLATIHLDNLPDFVQPGKMDSAAKYVMEVDAKEGDFAEAVSGPAPLAKELGHFYRRHTKIAKQLGELMHASTLARADPSQPYKPIHSGQRVVIDKKTGAKTTKPRELTEEQQAENRQHQRAYQVLKTAWDRLGAAGKNGVRAQNFYVRLRDAYMERDRAIHTALLDRIDAMEEVGAPKRQQLMEYLRKEFETGRIAPYFPLFRQGKFWAVARDKETKAVVSFVRDDNRELIKQWENRMAADGYAVGGGQRIGSDREIIESVDPGFVAKTMELIDEFDNPELADEVWQLYLKRLPEMSVRKHYVHRKGRPGFTEDYVRAFAHYMFHSSHQLARLKHVHQMQAHLRNAKTELTALDNARDPERDWAAPVLNELLKRHDWVMNPESATLANILAAGGFVYFLANSLAAMVVNTTQTPLMTYPRLAGMYGHINAVREITRSAVLWGSKWGPLANRTRGWEREAMDEATRTNLFTTTNVHSLASIGEAGVMAGSRAETAMEVAGYVFQKGEQFNREVAYLSAIRLYAQKHSAEAAAAAAAPPNSPVRKAFVEAAAASGRRVTHKTQFNFANANRPRVMQGNAAKVVLLFKQFPVHMIYRMIRDFDESGFSKQYDNESAADFKQRKHEARTRFLGTLGQLAIHGGVRAFPLYWLAQLIANAFWGDDDDPYDMDAALQKNLEDLYGKAAKWIVSGLSDETAKKVGKTAASVTMEGATATALGAKLSSRIGMNNLLLQEQPEGKYGGDLALFYLAQMAGPYASVAQNWADALYPKEEGYTDRAFEKSVPKWVRDPAKAIRFAREGVQTKKGDVILPKGMLSPYEIGLQAAGFTPLKVDRQQMINRAITDDAAKILRRAHNLVNQYKIAAKVGDTKSVQEILKDMDKFDAKHPGFSLSAGLGASLRESARRDAESLNGVYVDRRLRSALEAKYGNEPMEPTK